MSYFNRKWSLSIDGKPFIQSVGGLQLRVVFDIHISPQNAISFADIRIYNLSKQSAIQRNQSIVFSAGYENASDTIFIGTVINVLREREGPNTVTRLLCRSGTALNDRGAISASYGANGRVVDVLRDFARAWPRFLDIDESQFTERDKFTSGYIADGDIISALNDLGYQFNFDWLQERGSIVIARRGYDRNGQIFDVNQYTGMRRIPEVTRGPEGLGVTVSMSLNPYIRSSSRINVKSEYATFNTGNLYVQELGGDSSVDGIYNVFSLAYKGDSHGNNWDIEIDGIRNNTAQVTPVVVTPDNGKLIWGAKVDQDFRVKVRAICKNLNMNPNWLMPVIAFETGETFNPAQGNLAGGGAVGLIQFLPSTARGLGTSTSMLGSMTAVAQLDYVEKYYQPYASQIKNIGDCYMAVLWPAALGKPDSYVLWTKTGQYQREYNANAGLDTNRDGAITRGEAVDRINKAAIRGSQFVR